MNEICKTLSISIVSIYLCLSIRFLNLILLGSNFSCNVLPCVRNGFWVVQLVIDGCYLRLILQVLPPLLIAMLENFHFLRLTFDCFCFVLSNSRIPICYILVLVSSHRCEVMDYVSLRFCQIECVYITAALVASKCLGLYLSQLSV